jgi:protein-S-isoprenylcysteine O-methyltransferase Ste14
LLAVPITGILLILCGLIVRWIAIATLKQHFTVDVAIGKDHRIIKTGLYRFIRHPAYAGTLLSFLGVGIYFSNYLSLAVIFVPICAAFMYRIEVEEKALADAFGEEYRSYQAATKRLVPGLY